MPHKNKTPDYKIACIKRYEERHKINKVRVGQELYEVLTNGVFGETQVESSRNIYEVLVQNGLV